MGNVFNNQRRNTTTTSLLANGNTIITNTTNNNNTNNNNNNLSIASTTININTTNTSSSNSGGSSYNNININSNRSNNNNNNNSNRNHQISIRKHGNTSSLASYFFIAGQRFDIIVDQSQPFLFGDKSDLNFIYSSKPVKFPCTSASLSSVTKVLKCLINVRKDTLKLVRVNSTNTENDTTSPSPQSSSKYTIEFKFDCDIDTKIEIYYFAKEKFTNGVLNYESISISNNDETPPYYESKFYKAGTNILFNTNNEHVITPSKYNYLNVSERFYDLYNCFCYLNCFVIFIFKWQYDQLIQIYPIVILCTAKSEEYKTHSHVVYATLDKSNDTDNYTLKLLKQKQVIDGIFYSLQEIYGIEKKSKILPQIEEEQSVSVGVTSNVSATQAAATAVVVDMAVASSKSIANSETSIQQQQQQQAKNENPNEYSCCNTEYNLSRKNSEKYTRHRRDNDSSVDIYQGVIDCVICMSEKRDTLILPCRHLCLCKSCANNLRTQSNNCPICRVPFNALLQMEIMKVNSRNGDEHSSQIIKTTTSNSVTATASVASTSNGGYYLHAKHNGGATLLTGSDTDSDEYEANYKTNVNLKDCNLTFLNECKNDKLFVTYKLNNNSAPESLIKSHQELNDATSKHDDDVIIN